MNWVDNMDLIYLGVITGTHGIKGELKIKSDFQYKDKAFKVGNKLLIDSKEYEIKSYRRHKEKEMVTLDNFTNINEVLFLVKRKVYIDKSSLKLDGLVLDSDLVNYEVVVNDKIGKIEEIFLASPTNKIIRVNLDGKEVLVPYNDEFIEKIDQENKKVYVKVIDGMM